MCAVRTEVVHRALRQYGDDPYAKRCVMGLLGLLAPVQVREDAGCNVIAGDDG